MKKGLKDCSDDGICRQMADITVIKEVAHGEPV
jgi:hypothetical protein